MPESSALDLVKTLIAQTEAGHVTWEPADAVESVFITKAASGTVALEGFSPFNQVGQLAGVGTRLVIRDRQGNVLQRIDGSPFGQMGGLFPDGVAQAAARIPELYKAIMEQRTAADSKIAQLANEFKGK